MSANRHYAKGDHELEAITANWPIKGDPATFSVESMRAQFDVLRKKRHETPPTITNLIVEDFNIPVMDGEIMLRKYIPRDSSGLNPLLVWYHGGGWVLGHPEVIFDDDFCRLACVTHNMTVVSVDYRLAPEHPFPTGLEDSYAALKWVASHSDDLKVDLDKGFLVGGESAGANFAAVLSLVARGDPDFQYKITGQLLGIPTLCTIDYYPTKWRDELLSGIELQDVHIMPPHAREFFTKCYGCKDESDIRRSPLLAMSHANLPCAVIQVAGNDPLRDEGILYSKILQDSSVATKLTVYAGGFHGFHQMASHTTLARKYKQESQEGIQWLLEGDVSGRK